MNYRICVVALSGLTVIGVLVVVFVVASKNPKSLLRIHGDPVNPFP